MALQHNELCQWVNEIVGGVNSRNLYRASILMPNFQWLFVDDDAAVIVVVVPTDEPRPGSCTLVILGTVLDDVPITADTAMTVATAGSHYDFIGTFASRNESTMIVGTRANVPGSILNMDEDTFAYLQRMLATVGGAAADLRTKLAPHGGRPISEVELNKFMAAAFT